MITAQPIPPIPPIPPVPDIPTVQVPAPVIFDGPPPFVMAAAVAMVAIIAAGVVLLPLVRAWARRLEGKTGDQGLFAEVETLKARVAELEQVHHRVAELEERVDFSERLLTQGRATQPISGGRDES